MLIIGYFCWCGAHLQRGQHCPQHGGEGFPRFVSEWNRLRTESPAERRRYNQELLRFEQATKGGE